MKLSGFVEPLFLIVPKSFKSLYVPFLVVFMDLQMSKIGCVNYACFPKSGHILGMEKNIKVVGRQGIATKCL